MLPFLLKLYVGRLVWNRLRYVKNPDTGKRVSRINPAEAWKIVDVPHLRIVEDDVRVAPKRGAIELFEQLADLVVRLANPRVVQTDHVRHVR